MTDRATEEVSRAKEGLSQATDRASEKLSRAKEGLSQATDQASEKLSRAKEGLSQATDRASEKLSRAKEQASDRLSKASEGLSRAGRGVTNVSRTVTGGVGKVASAVVGSSEAAYRNTREASRWATERAGGTIRSTGQFVQDNPLAAGAIALGVGALLALILPSSRREHELLGEASDEVKAKVRGTIDEQVGKAKSVAGAAADAALKAARDRAEAEGVPLPSQQEAGDVADAIADSIPSAADTIPPSARDTGARAQFDVQVSPLDRPAEGSPDAAIVVDLPGQGQTAPRDKV